MSNLRVGMGYDVHQLQSNLPFLLGGVNISHTKGVVAHSDGDIVFHALSDALLGAAGLGDIGCFFPDTDLANKNLDSSVILSETLQKLVRISYSVVNIDITVVLEKPKLSPYIMKIRQSLSNYLHIDIDRINVKATTSERMGFVGSEDGLACYAVVLIEKK